MALELFPAPLPVSLPWFPHIPDEVMKLREQYLAATEAEKKQMERRYGRQCIRQIIEDSFTEEWLQQYSKKCPHCGTHIQVCSLQV